MRFRQGAQAEVLLSLALVMMTGRVTRVSGRGESRRRVRRGRSKVSGEGE